MSPESQCFHKGRARVSLITLYRPRTNNEHLGASLGEGRFEALATHQRSLQSVCGFIALQLELSITVAAIAPLGVFL